MAGRPATSDADLASMVALEATSTPGVARLHPYVTQGLASPAFVTQAARQAVTSATRRATVQRDPDAVDTAGVDIDHDAGTGTVTVTVRVVASTVPPILEVVRDLQRRIGARVAEHTGTPPLVIVNVLDIDDRAV